MLDYQDKYERWTGNVELAVEILRCLSLLSGVYYTEAVRVMNIGIPLANLINVGAVEKVTEQGREDLEDTFKTLLRFRAYQSLGLILTAQALWLRFANED